mmetsp:Transcript_9855/g.28334  ORF Transcript_9855/g.28334 Transcript_9855/m.28334 type:complete len:129 (-) Transcript_9855:454-840(-)
MSSLYCPPDQLGYKTSAKKIDHIMNELDINQDGKVEFVEFMRPTAKKYKEEQELEQGADADRAFEYFDKNFDAKLTASEIYEGMQHLKQMSAVSLEQIEDFVVKYVDLNGDQFVSYDELESIDPAKLV